MGGLILVYLHSTAQSALVRVNSPLLYLFHSVAFLHETSSVLLKVGYVARGVKETWTTVNHFSLVTQK